MMMMMMTDKDSPPQKRKKNWNPVSVPTQEGKERKVIFAQYHLR